MTAPAARQKEPPPAREPIEVETTCKMVAGRDEPVAVKLRYDPNDPFAVEIRFHDGIEEIPWTASRDLIDAGIKDYAGHGDIRLWPTDTGEVELLLESPEGRALFQFDKKILREFIRSTYKMVPRGKELTGVDMDAVVSRLLT